MAAKPPLKLQATTLWEYPSQHYGPGMQGDRNFPGATPSWIVWNLLQRYTRPGDLVVDPMAGSGTTLDVARDLGRRALGYDVSPQRGDIFNVDARRLPLEDGKADFVFIDPPYSTHIQYSDDPRCIGRLDAREPAYWDAMRRVAAEAFRVMKDRRYMAVYVSDSFRKGKPFCPIGFELFAVLRQFFKPVDIIAVVRHNAKLRRSNWQREAVQGNFFLRGFNYLLIMKKELDTHSPTRAVTTTSRRATAAAPTTVARTRRNPRTKAPAPAARSATSAATARVPSAPATPGRHDRQRRKKAPGGKPRKNAPGGKPRKGAPGRNPREKSPGGPPRKKTRARKPGKNAPGRKGRGKGRAPKGNGPCGTS